MNLALLPNLIALVIFIAAFRPLARRAGPQTNPWFLAWIFVLLHNAALIFGGSGTVSNGHVSIHLIAEWTIELGGICFLRAAANTPSTWQSLIISAEMLLPIFAQSALVVFDIHRPWLQASCTLLMLVPGLHLLRLERGHKRPRARMAKGFIIAALCLAPIAALDPVLALAFVHCFLFLGSAVLYWDYADHSTAGALITVGGFALWGLLNLMSLLLFRSDVTSPVLDAVCQFPSYIVAYGMVLTIIEEHVRRTESLSLHDPLTGLPNRRLFEDRLQQMLVVSPNSGTMLACLVIDLDNFKTINDTLGHSVGDGLLQAVATRLSWHTHAGDTLARTGGDEFAVVLPRLQSLEHLRFTVGAMMSATSAPVVVGDHAIDVGLSIGIAINPEGSLDADGLRHRADEAMYEAKRGGGNRFAYWGGQPDEVAHLLAGVPENLRHLAQVELHIR
ncbi:MAG: GGDEF domain-containing protein [Acidobacteriaceae bacterium]